MEWGVEVRSSGSPSNSSPEIQHQESGMKLEGSGRILIYLVKCMVSLMN